MKGDYLENMNKTPRYLLKRHIKPGQRVKLSDIYEEYKHHDFESYSAFIEWLLDVKLTGRGEWRIAINVDEEETPLNETLPLMQ